MDGESYTTYRYRLRSSGAVPINPAEFLVQTFGAQRNRLTTWPATTTITRSDEFIGASIVGEYTSANFQRLPYLTQGGQWIFSGQTVGKDEFIDEDQIPGS
jgi:hypothetical protein